MLDFKLPHDCWLCGRRMHSAKVYGQISCYFCQAYYSDGTYWKRFGENIPYITFKDKNYSMTEWERFLKLKAFW